ncbi:hypothetical protein [Rubeoparvulum massiliense]|uniref:hypothetical protein n=1 Tax=Rubeoparvulum massiliense TaxID=1631346 RepID=UPI00065E3E81|nr:hypothetical protein [Rubeoparvulum massiliense]
MLPAGDFYIFIVLLLLGGGWLLWWFLRKVVQFGWRLPSHPSIQHQDQLTRPLAQILQQHGYEPLSGREQVPITIELNDGRQFTTRLTIDGWAEKAGELYVIKQRRARSRVSFTATSLRDHLLIYSLLYRCNGILYIDLDHQIIHEIHFAYPSLRKHWRFASLGIPFLLGMSLMYFLIK